jgi:hypothetical protein
VFKKKEEKKQEKINEAKNHQIKLETNGTGKFKKV